MKIASDTSSRTAHRRQQGRTTCDTLVILVTAVLIIAATFSTVNRITTGGWSEDRLRKVAAKMVNTTRYAEHAGIVLVE